MQYVDFGKTGARVSRLGMGCMRLPVTEKDDKTVINEEKSIALIHRAMELGVNFFDTAPYYCDKLSEVILGKALRGGRREKVYISTKNPIENDSGDDYEKRLETSLKNLGVTSIDFYHFWGISMQSFTEKVKAKDGPFERAKKLKEQGVIKHISFSFHDGGAKEKEGDKLIEVLKNGEGVLESVLCQYNLMDRNKEPGIALANQMGLGTVVMGPVGGGRLGAPTKVIQDMLPGKVQSSAELALRFVLSNPHVHIALSGMSDMEQLEENVRIADNISPLNSGELMQIEAMMKENERLAGLYCTGCNYCMPCPRGINIPAVFNIMNYHRIYKITDYAKKNYAEIGQSPWMKFENASACNACGECESKCPQSIPIREQMKETHKTLAS
ncbi:MAG: aldo/keto reductase [Treponema sp.]|nr:aldo/keto reductase [Treponema sp.]